MSSFRRCYESNGYTGLTDGDGQCRLIIPIDRLDSLVRFSYKTELVNREVIKPLSKDKW